MYVIIGANGFLGSYIIQTILEETTDKIFALSRNIADLKSTNRVTWEKFDVLNNYNIVNLASNLEKYQDIKVIYLAAYHHPDKVENNFEYAWNVNIISLSIFLNKIKNIKCFFYPSTDTVYGDGKKDYRFKEDDRLNPVNKYGKQKIAAEILVNTYGYNVVRLPFLIGPSLLNHKKHFYDVILESISNSRPIGMFEDSFRSTLDFLTVSKLLINLIEKYSEHIPKILNLSGDDALSKYDVGLMIAKQNHIDTKYIKPIKTDDAVKNFTVRRAKTSVMDNSKIKEILHINEIKLMI